MISPGDMVVAYQKREDVPVWARFKPKAITPAMLSIDRDKLKAFKVDGHDILIYVGEEKMPSRPKRDKLVQWWPEITFYAVFVKDGVYWLSSADVDLRRVPRQ